MRSLTALRSTAFLVLFTASAAFGQAQPDFSGTWTLDPASAPAGPTGGGPPRQVTITQDANTLTLSWTEDGTRIAYTYNLDGSDSRNEQVVETATWKDDRIVIVRQLNFGGNAIQQRRVLSMDGDDLVFELSRSNVQGDEPTVVRLVYKKT